MVRQADRSAATRTALIAAGRELFAAHGYADVGTEAIVAAAGVTRGAMYHQFATKAELFAAVFEAAEADLMVRLAAVAGLDDATTDPVEAMRRGVAAWLDACADREVQRIVLLDGPAVLGWARWRRVCQNYALGMVEALLAAVLDAARLPNTSLRPLAHVLMGALDEAALYLTEAEDAAGARAGLQDALERLIDALVA